MSENHSRILLVEDEPLVAMDIEMSLRAEGYDEVATVADIGKTLSLLGSGNYDAALLDLDLKGQRSDCVASALAEKHIPFAFVTGYSREALPEEFPRQIVLKKPFSTSDLLSVIDRLLH